MFYESRDGHVAREARALPVTSDSYLGALSSDTHRLSLWPLVAEQWPFDLRTILIFANLKGL